MTVLHTSPQHFTDFFPPNELVLESGQKIGPITLQYETYGTLNDSKSNAVLICHALSGDAHVSGVDLKDPTYVGWWDSFVGPGKAIDTNQFFVICSNVLGGCKGSTGPQSIDPKTQKPYGLTFPIMTIGDMVNAQEALIHWLGIESLHAVIGGSMGGMQALEWAIQFPSKVKRCIPIATTSRLSPQALAFDAVGRNAIISDPNYNKGHYYDQPNQPENGLAIARMIGHITYLSEESMDYKFGRKLQKKDDYGYDFSTDFQVESYLVYQGNKFGSRFDANSYVYLTKAISYFDLEKKYGSLESAFERIQSKMMVVSITSDWLYTPKESKAIVKALMKLNKQVTYCEINSDSGHDAFLIDHAHLGKVTRNFLMSEAS